MGMFDYVKHEAPCYKCGNVLTEWQSKDGDCELATLDITQIDCFYEYCDNCKSWNQYRRVNPRIGDREFVLESIPSDED